MKKRCNIFMPLEWNLGAFSFFGLSVCDLVMLSFWLAEQEVRGLISGLAATIPEIGYLLLPSRDICEIPLKRRKSSIQPTNNSVMLSVNFNLCHNFSVVKDRDFIFGMHENNSFGLCCCKGHSCFTNTPCSSIHLP